VIIGSKTTPTGKRKEVIKLGESCRNFWYRAGRLLVVNALEEEEDRTG